MGRTFGTDAAECDVPLRLAIFPSYGNPTTEAERAMQNAARPTAALVVLLVALGVHQRWQWEWQWLVAGRDLGLYPPLLLLHIMGLMVFITTSHSLRFADTTLEELYTAEAFSATCHLMVAVILSCMVLVLVMLTLAPTHVAVHIGSLVACVIALAARLWLQSFEDHQRARTLWARFLITVSVVSWSWHVVWFNLNPPEPSAAHVAAVGCVIAAIAPVRTGSNSTATCPVLSVRRTQTRPRTGRPAPKLG